MISSTIIIYMAVAAAICVLFPITIFIYCRKKEKINFKPTFIGMMFFIVLVVVLEPQLHKFVIGNELIKNPIMFSVYGAFAAGIFEETGRFIAFKTVLKKNHEWKDGFAYGIGHGGIEAIIIGAVTNIQYISFSTLMNNGLFDSVVATKVTGSQLEQVNKIKDLLINLDGYTIFLTVVERIFAFGIQVALTMVILYAIRYRKNIYVFVAIILHALIDFPAGLYQMNMLPNIFVAELMVFVYFVIAILFLVKSKKILSKEEVITNS